MRSIGGVVGVLAVAVALAVAGAARADSGWVGPGASGFDTGPRGGDMGGCQNSQLCNWVQVEWYPTVNAAPALPYPWDAPAVITGYRINMAGPGQVSLRVVRKLDVQTDSYQVLARSEWLQAPGPASQAYGVVFEAPARLPIHKGETVAFGFAHGAGAWFDYWGGDSSKGWGDTSFIDADGDTLTSAQQPPGDEGIDFTIRIEPDADGDGFGDESQDRCPGAAGTAEGCVAGAATAPPPAADGGGGGGTTAGSGTAPASASLLRSARVAGGRLTYTLSRRAVVRLRVQRPGARRGSWRTVRTLKLSGRAGAHAVRVPAHRGRTRLALAVGSTTRDLRVAKAIVLR